MQPLPVRQFHAGEDCPRQVAESTKFQRVPFTGYRQRAAAKYRVRQIGVERLLENIDKGEYNYGAL